MVEKILVINKTGEWSRRRWDKWGCDLGGRGGYRANWSSFSGRGVLLEAHRSQKEPVQGTNGLEARPSIKAYHYDWEPPTDSRQTHWTCVEKGEEAGEDDDLCVCVCVCVFRDMVSQEDWHWSVFIVYSFSLSLSFLTIIISHDTLMYLLYPALLPLILWRIWSNFS